MNGRPLTESLKSTSKASAAHTMKLLEVARRFYLGMESKVTIAEHMGISRFTVTRLLEEAHDLGIVRIDIRAPADVDFDLSFELATKTNLKRAIVLPTLDQSSVMQSLADAAASYLIDTCSENDVLGLLVSRTTSMILERIRELPTCSIVQLAGVCHSSYFDHNPAETIRAMTARVKGQTFPIYAPMIFDNAELVSSMRGQIGIADAVGQFDRLTMAFFAIGGWSASSSGIFNLIGEDERRESREEGVVAEVVSHLLDGRGQRRYPKLSERCLAIPYDLLMNVPDRVAVGGGLDRAEAVLASLRAGLVTTLITDADTARYVLDHVSGRRT